MFQVYKGLDIISNKVTPEEQEQVPHHMIDIVEPTTDYSVVKFRDTCLSIVSFQTSNQDGITIGVLGNCGNRQQLSEN